MTPETTPSTAAHDDLRRNEPTSDAGGKTDPPGPSEPRRTAKGDGSTSDSGGKTIVLATRNPHKLGELAAVLSGIGWELRSAFDFAQLAEVEEDQSTLEGNALKKARYTFEMTGLPSLADDTGLEVDDLGGLPGVYSARFAGEKATYAENVEKLLFDLDRSERRQFQTLERKARFRTVIAFVTARGEWLFEGVCEGQILRKVRGDAGFGYDPVFLPEGYQLSFAEMTPELKNQISHRGRAVAAFVAALQAGHTEMY